MDETQKIVNGKRLLKGPARTFIQYGRHAKTWSKLKKLLIEEFERIIDSHEIHKALSREKKKNDESYQNYIYRMCGIAAQANIEQTSTIKYIMEGIADDPNNKMMLYTATTIKQLKERLL